MSDFLNPTNNNNTNFYEALKQAKYAYVDFLICSPKEFKPLAAILIEEQWIGNLSVDEILEEAELKVFCFDNLDEDSITFELDYCL